MSKKRHSGLKYWRGATWRMDRRVEQLFHEAMDLESNERHMYLQNACGGDQSLAAEVEALLEDGLRGEALVGSAIGRLAGTMTPSVGARVGPYRLVKQIGEGGMGVVFLATRDDGEFEQYSAIKFVQGGPEVKSRFRQERQILARLQHPNIARLLDGGVTDDGVAYMVMEYFPGEPLTEYCTRRALPMEDRLKLFRRACDAVEHAHRSLIIHRDLKPSNILVNEAGDLKLLDFGIAKLLEDEPGQGAMTATGMHFFTPDYASPEQVRGEPVTTATDVYSLGAVLFELVGGERPHRMANYSPAEITRAICEEPLRLPGASTELDQILQMALRKEPERRYGSVGQFSDDIGRFLSHHPVLAKPDNAAYRLRKFARRNRLAVAAGSLAVVSLAGGTGIAAWQARVARQEAEQAQRRFTQVRKLARTMLFDLDGKISNLTGATDARELLVKTALEYLDSLHNDAKHDPSLRQELAAAYERVGDVLGQPARPNLGHRREALQSYRKAMGLLEEMNQADPLALAGVYLKVNELQGAPELTAKAAAATRTALASRPNDPAVIQLAISAERAQGAYFNNRNVQSKALEHFDSALKLAERLRQQAPGNAAEQNVASMLIYIADAALRKGDPQLAIQSVDRAQVIREKLLAAHPNDAHQMRSIFKTYLYRGHALGNPEYFHLERPQEAIENYRKAAAIAERMLEIDPKDALARGDVADANWSLGLTISGTNPTAARPFVEKALAANMALVNGSRHTLSFLHNAANTHFTLAGVLLKLGERDAALTSLRTAEKMQRSIADSRPKQLGLRHNMMRTLARLGEAELQAGNRQAGEKAIEEAAQIAGSVPRDEAFTGKIPDIAYCFQTMGNLAHTRGGDAKAWHQKSLRLWEELEKTGLMKQHVAARKAELTRLVAQTKR